MKKALSLIVAAAASLSLMAQVADASADVKADGVKATTLDQPAMNIQEGQFIADRSTKALTNASSDVWYKKPAGTYYQTGTSSSTGTVYCYNLVPMFLPQTYTNMCADKDNAKWFFGTNAVSGDADNNLVYSYSRMTGNSAFYSPSITVPEDTFKLGYTLATQNLTFTRPEVQSVCYVDRNAGYYTGFSNMTFFGTHTATVNNANAYGQTLIQSFDAPAAPMYLEDVWFWVKSTGGTHFTTDDAYVNFYIYSLNDAGTAVETMYYSGKITKENLTVSTSNTSTGYIEVKFPEPLVISKAFRIEISGFHNDGVDFGVYMANVGSNTTLGYDSNLKGGAYPTLMTRVNDEGTAVGTYWQYNATTGVQYNAAFFFDMMWDVAVVDETEMTAPAAGGQVLTPNSEENAIYVRTTLPIVEDDGSINDNYGIEGLPEWLSIAQVNNSLYTNYSYNVLFLVADPNTTGDTRTATLRLVSDKGAKTEDIVVTQESLPKLYILGEVNGNTWDPSTGVEMTTEDGDIYTANVTLSRPEAAPGLKVDDTPGVSYCYFSFTEKLAESSDDWASIADYRIGAVSEKTDDNPNGDFRFYKEMFGMPISMVKEAEPKAIQLAEGTYTFTFYKANMQLVIEGQSKTAIDDINANNNVVATRYYNLAGVESATPFQGVNIMVNTMSDGSKVATKVVK